MSSLLPYWYFHLPNFVLAAVMYTLIGRLLLSFFVPENWTNYIWRAFVAITRPVVGTVRLVTPAVLPGIVVIIFSVLWLMLLRLALVALFGHFGLLPDISNG
ncbi:YggT family protein [Taklimakanibacter lacteus]|uniref:YggT family protein n=1 Tax=Taklimakanibacter lacteus TaxID=2268456 RepID=UPI0013C5234F